MLDQVYLLVTSPDSLCMIVLETPSWPWCVNLKVSSLLQQVDRWTLGIWFSTKVFEGFWLQLTTGIILDKTPETHHHLPRPWVPNNDEWIGHQTICGCRMRKLGRFTSWWVKGSRHGFVTIPVQVTGVGVIAQQLKINLRKKHACTSKSWLVGKYYVDYLFSGNFRE